MSTIQFIQVTPTELANQISENLKDTLRTNLQTQEQVKEILTRKDVADLFEVSLVCIHDWIKKGILRPYKLGNRTYFKRSEILETLFNSNRS
ncbi:MAG: hypothetical protein JWO58_2544 [Chitinophagaceae bacterium]|nr:hypothetical protein [Chitinophagaceae bacterium]